MIEHFQLKRIFNHDTKFDAGLFAFRWGINSRFYLLLNLYLTRNIYL